MDKTKLKQKLETELAVLESELKAIGHRNPKNPADWEASSTYTAADSADRNETADTIEEFEENTAIVKDLEIRYNNVKDALESIGSNTYGVCTDCGELIDEKRLEANPAATTCLAHAK